MEEDLNYDMSRPNMGTAVIINNLDKEQEPTRKDVEALSDVFKEIGFDVNIHRNLTSQGMNNLKRKLTEDSHHKNNNVFVLAIISHGSSDNFLMDTEGNKTWNIESLITEICDIQALVGRPKLFFIEACRGQAENFGVRLMTKSSPPPAMTSVSLPNKLDVFVGFATVPGFVSFTASGGSPYLQALSSLLKSHHRDSDLADIHLLVKRRLAGMKLGGEGARQGAEERSSLLSKLMFSRFQGKRKGKITEGKSSMFSFGSSSKPSAPATPSSSTPSTGLTYSRTSAAPSTGLTYSRTSAAPSTGLTYSSNIPALLRDASPTPSRITPLNYPSTSSAAPSSSSSRLSFFSSQTSSPPLSSTTAFISSAMPRSTLFTSPSTIVSKPTQSSLSSSIFSSPSSLKSSVAPVRTVPIQRSSSVVHTVEIHSSDIEKGLNELLTKIKEVYGGEGKLKTKKKKKELQFSFKYKGPERATKLLEGAIDSVKELQNKGNLWKFTQRLEVTTSRSS